MTTDWYLKNLGWIRARDERLYQQLRELVEPRPEVDWGVVDEMMRPREWLFGLGPFSASATILQYGFGDGEHILYVLNQLAREGHLVLLVPDLAEFLELMHDADMEPILGDPRVHPVLYGLNDEMAMRYMAACFTAGVSAQVKIFVLPGYEELYPEGLTFLEQTLAIVVQWIRSQ